MDLKIMQLTGEQRAELADMQAEITRMFAANPREPGVIMAQIIPPVGVMRVRVLDHDMVSQLADVFPPEWADEGAGEKQALFDLRCPCCHSPLTEADVAGDDDALLCPDCGEWVEYSEAVDAWQESVSHSAPPPAEPSNSVAES